LVAIASPSLIVDGALVRPGSRLWARKLDGEDMLLPVEEVMGDQILTTFGGWSYCVSLETSACGHRRIRMRTLGGAPLMATCESLRHLPAGSRR
jgi:hypothetical protein